MYTKYKTSKAIILAHCSLKNKKSNMPSCNKCTHHIHVKIKCVALFSFWWTVLNLIGEALTLLMYFSQLCLSFDLNGREFIDIIFFCKTTVVSCHVRHIWKKNHFTFVIELLFNVHKPFCLHVWCACLSSLMADGHWDSKWISINRSMHICTYMRTVNKMQI